MNPDSRAEPSLLPSLLRPEVFNNPGAADWVATAPASRPVSPWILMAGAVMGLLVLVLVVTLVSHRQVHHYTGALIPGSLRCMPTQDPCGIDLQIVQPPAHLGDLAEGSALGIATAHQPAVQVHVLGRPLDSRDRAGAASSVIRVSWPRGVAAPVGRIDIAAARTRTLLGWIMPRDSGPPISGVGQ
ncbi:MAG: hypothetical protein ACREPV_00630 [Lysobacter sp.]